MTQTNIRDSQTLDFMTSIHKDILRLKSHLHYENLIGNESIIRALVRCYLIEAYPTHKPEYCNLGAVDFLSFFFFDFFFFFEDFFFFLRHFFGAKTRLGIFEGCSGGFGRLRFRTSPAARQSGRCYSWRVKQNLGSGEQKRFMETRRISYVGTWRHSRLYTECSRWFYRIQLIWKEESTTTVVPGNPPTNTVYW